MVGKIETQFYVEYSFFLRKSYRWQNNVEKYCRSRQITDDNIIRRMHIASWMHKSYKHTHTDTQNKLYLWLLHGNNGHVKAPQCDFVFSLLTLTRRLSVRPFSLISFICLIWIHSAFCHEDWFYLVDPTEQQPLSCLLQGREGQYPLRTVCRMRFNQAVDGTHKECHDNSGHSSVARGTAVDWGTAL